MIGDIYIIESLNSNERHTGKELYDDVIVRYVDFYKKKIYHEYTSVKSKKEFENKISEILNCTNDKEELIIHIEAHGGSEVLQFSNGDLMKWIDLEKKMMEINLKSKNKLHLNFATCHGMHVAEKLDLKNTAPYQSFVSALRELSPTEILSDNSVFYEQIIEKQNIFEAYIEFCKQCPQTQLRIKDLKTSLELILNIQITRFLPHATLLKDFLDNFLNINIQNHELNEKDNNGKIEYILNLFFSRYLPK